MPMAASTTAARRRAARIEFLISATLNNILGQHEAFTLSYAGVSPLKELQYLSGYYSRC